MIGKALYSRLSSDPGVSGMVGTRIYPWDAAPQNPVLPHIVYLVESSDAVESLRGSSGLCFADVRIDCVSDRYLTSQEIAEAVRLALQGAAWTAAGISVRGTRCIDAASDRPEDAEPGDEGAMFHAVGVYEMQYGQAVP